MSTCFTARSTTGVETGFRPPASSDGDAEELGRPEQREDVDRCCATAATKGAPGHDAGAVRRHDDGHRHEGIAMLGPTNGGRERVERGGPVAGGGDLDRHSADRTEGV